MVRQLFPKEIVSSIVVCQCYMLSFEQFLDQCSNCFTCHLTQGIYLYREI